MADDEETDGAAPVAPDPNAQRFAGPAETELMLAGVDRREAGLWQRLSRWVRARLG